MALSPKEPDQMDKEAMEKYNIALQDKLANPHKWAVTKSVVTQSVDNQNKKREAIVKAEAPEPVKKTRRKRVTQV